MKANDTQSSVVSLKARGKVEIETQKCLLNFSPLIWIQSLVSQKILFSPWSLFKLHTTIITISYLLSSLEKAMQGVHSSTSLLFITSPPFGHTDPAGSEIQPFCWLVVLWRSPLWNANWSVTFPRARWRRAVPLHPHGQPLLPTMAWEGG